MNHRNFLKILAGGLLTVGAGCVFGEGGCRSFKTVSELARNCEEPFNFAIIADSHLGYYKQPETARAEFAKTINQINLLRPDFVVCCGDMISGAPRHKTNEEIEQMWDEFDKYAGKIEVPVVLVCGNHDINIYGGSGNDSTYDIYSRRYGKTYFSFDHKGSHFVILNGEVVKQEGGIISLEGVIDEEQFKWLSKDFEESTDAKHRYVFIHRPVWQPIYNSEKAMKFWKNSLHPLFVKNKVDAVFAGHLHRYCSYGSIDGVRYYVLANSGGGRIGVNEFANCTARTIEALGGWRCIMLVRVQGEKWDNIIVRRDGIYEDDIVTNELVEAYGNFKKSIEDRLGGMLKAK